MLDLVKYRKVSFVFSGALFAVSVVFLAFFGLKLGIDFTGGSLIELKFTGERPENALVQEALAPLSLGSATVQTSEEDGMIIKTRFVTEEEHQRILTALRAKFENDNDKVLEERIDTIGPAISSQLKQRAGYAIAAVCLAIILYIAYTFRKVSRPVESWKYGVAAFIALAHDIVITMGIFSILGKFFGVEADIPFVVALLTVLGYSVNDTIVVFDRIRENLIYTGTDHFTRTVNEGINSTIMRSLNTTFTTLLALVALYFFGGDTIHNFSLALIIGIFFGAYSSIFVASPILMVWEEWSARRAG